MDLQQLVPLPIESEALEELAEHAKGFAFARGMVMRSRSDIIPYTHAVTFIPFALLPSPFPEEQFNLAYQLQKDVNTVYYRATNDYDFLRESLQHTIDKDEFTRRLWHMYERTRETQKDVPSLAIIRSDYMVGRDGAAKQVEVNTISAAFGGVSVVTRELHKYVADKLGRNRCPPENNATNLARALAKAWRTYVEMHNTTDAVLCFAIEDRVFNPFDQRQLELLLVEKFDVPAHRVVYRKNIDFESARIMENGALVVKDQEVAVLYMRTWYDPAQLPTERSWAARETVERSRCIKGPNLAWHLVGCKKIQQELARPGSLERYCDDKAQARRIRKVFTGLFALEEPEILEMVMKSPEQYVIKPQREGGGNNIYGKDITRFLESLPEDHRKEYIAMEMIDAFSSKNYLVNGERVHLTDVMNELGVFGCILASAREIYFNEMDCGWILRTKDKHCKEGGIAAGFGHLDSPYLS
ncbi:glutathione synthetase, chloroplastic [Galendromus occidentalis]|uniref:Glutathione synthetase n=1 Tax=Galendromus occidentalis TaxID=34638 RepID=A0AAJ7PB16_9ACAR|nr:glutathione synthetase, chloroplastic [Galendromus occidentalis]